MKARYRNYIFDLYGTLVDIWTDEEEPRLWLEAARFFLSRGAAYRPDELRKEYLRLCREEQGRSPDPLFEIELRTVFRRLYESRGVLPTDPLIGETAVFFRKHSTKKLRVYPWVDSVFGMIREAGSGIYLLSNAQACFTVYELKKLGLYGEFDGIVLSSDAGFKKPSPSIMDKLLKGYSLNASECLMTGNDQSADMAVARAVNMDGLYIKTETSGEYDPRYKTERELLDGDYSRLPQLMGLEYEV